MTYCCVTSQTTLRLGGFKQPLHLVPAFVGQERGDGSARQLSLGSLMQLQPDVSRPGLWSSEGSTGPDIRGGPLAHLAMACSCLEAQLDCRQCINLWPQGTRALTAPEVSCVAFSGPALAVSGCAVTAAALDMLEAGVTEASWASREGAWPPPLDGGAGSETTWQRSVWDGMRFYSHC